ncbi:MAG: FkbM family methyltransferase [Phycisphaerae bacterium]|nr:FkbM family methyltransferase [Phycisphaerae bacterium]
MDLTHPFRWLRWRLQLAAIGVRVRPAVTLPITFEGRNWPIPTGVIRPSDICYCGGVGEEIDLELWFARVCKADVFAFDPTPRAIAFVERLKDRPKNLVFKPYGLWSEDTSMRFYAPDDPTWVSHSVEHPRANDGRAYFDAPCLRLSTIMREFGHDRIDVLKMNIEGAESAVLDNMMREGIRPRMLTLTFEGKNRVSKTARYVRELDRYGLVFVARNLWVFTFVRKDCLPS